MQGYCHSEEGGLISIHGWEVMKLAENRKQDGSDGRHQRTRCEGRKHGQKKNVFFNLAKEEGSLGTVIVGVKRIAMGDEALRDKGEREGAG